MLLFGPSEARRYIASVRWQFARTMPQWPHEYTLRKWRPDLDDAFVSFVMLIGREGVVLPWPPPPLRPIYHHRYLTIDGWKYWTMGGSVHFGREWAEREKEETILINRAAAD